MAAAVFESGEAGPARVAGPAWSQPGLEIAAGRFPLAVERHILAMADVLVPGITTVTPHARYYALHGLVAHTAAGRNLDIDETDSLRRRCEVVMALASRPHQHSETGWVLPGAHGADALVRNVPAGPVDLAAAARSGPGGFVESARGFLNPYQASEVDLQVITSDANPQPGRRYDDAAVRGALGDVIEIADGGTFDPADLDSLGHLCVCAGGEASDGAWFGMLLSAADAPRASRAGGRRETLRAFGRILQTHDIDSPARQVAELLACGDFAAADPVVSQLDTARVWRGALLRNYSVGAWRQLWRWLVDQVHFSQGMTADELAAAFAAEVPDGTVGQFLSSLLRALPETVRLSRGSGRVCVDVADQVDEVIGEAPATDPQVRLVSSLSSPIIGELPFGPVDELAVSAPFHDSGALALRALVDRLQPQQVTLTYQPKLTVLDQPAVAQLAAELTAAGTRVRVLADPEQRYRHGKLVEWSVGGRRWALTGSPNLSGPALLGTVASGGNCELGVICPVPETLLPAGVEEAATAMRPAPAGSRSDRGSGPVLLGATRSGPDTLHIQLGRQLKGPEGQVFISPTSAPPESWDWLAVVPTGATDLEAFIDLPAASRVRVSQPGPDGLLRHSNVVRVLDEVRARAQHANPFATPQPRTQPVDLFTDAVLARRFVDEMVAFTSRNPAAPAAAAHSSTTRDDVTSSATANKSWQTYLDECAGRIGQPLLNFALGLLLPVGADPAEAADGADPGSRPDVRVSVVDWLEDAGDDREAGLSSDTAEAAASSRIDPGPAWVVLDLARESEQIRRAYQRYAARLAEAGERRGAKVVDLLSITRMILMIVAGGAWPDQDPERWRLVARSLRALAKVDLQQAEGAAASLTAVVLSAFRSAAPRGSHGDVELLFEDVAGTVAHLLPAVQRGLVAGYAQWLEPAFGLAVDVDVVLDRAAALVQDDPIDDALWLLQERGRDVHRHGEQLLHVTGRFPNAALVALTAVGAAERSLRVGAWAGQAGQAWALCVWEPPNLYVVVPGKPRYRWRHFRFPGLSGPATAAAQGELPTHFLVPHGPQNQPFADAEAALARLSLEGPEPLGSC